MPWATYTPAFARRTADERASSIPPTRLSNGDHRENRKQKRVRPPTSAFKHNATGTKGVSQVTTVLLA